MNYYKKQHNLGLPIWLDGKGQSVESCLPLQASSLTNFTVGVHLLDFMHSVNNYSHYSLLK